MDLAQRIQDFLGGSVYAVAGASRDRAKYGNKVLRCYLQNGRRAHPLHPSEREIEGVACVARLSELPEPVHGLSIITPPPISERLLGEAAAAGIRRLWLQPGAESPRVLERARELGLELIAGGPCLLVVLGFREE